MDHQDYFDLGHHTRPVTTTSTAAQTWFDRGLNWTYAFNHEEAARCFEAAAAADPRCAMAEWGLAYALGPNYNKPWEFFDAHELAETVERTHAAVQRALAKAEDSEVGPVERELIEALRARYPQAVAASAEECAVWNTAYADRMRAVHRLAPDDLDVAALYADALMNLTPWQLWDIRSGQPAPGARTVEAREVIERAMTGEAGAYHPGLLHAYIHLMEMSPTPEAALPAGDRLRGLVPDAGHLEHMPSHLEVLCGDYRRVLSDNTAAIAADEKYRARAGELNFYTLYRCHNLHFKLYGAMFLGRRQDAMDTVRRLEEAVPEELLRVQSPPMADWLEGFLAMRVHALVRFGRWTELLELPLPGDPKLYCVTTAMLHYARGVALAATGHVDRAGTERDLFRAAVTQVPDTRMLFNNTCADILAIAAQMLDGELAYRAGDFEGAFAALRRSVELDDTLPYDEPWGWMQPTRHALGALLLEQDRVAEAEAVYRADLGLDDTVPRALQHPGNVWALHGLHECLVRLGRDSEARIVAQQLTIAAALADVPVEASCFCRTTAVTDCCSGEG
ncbi:tetratricopeptide repeat protein [Streptomyces sp. NPDC057694]|uniref:tetratricopeptide repeat protein n=1 Tax=Streptomyces sp. NPDC057694 TaxID=3346216 RepID=UPI0036B65BE0